MRWTKFNRQVLQHVVDDSSENSFWENIGLNDIGKTDSLVFLIKTTGNESFSFNFPFKF